MMLTLVDEPALLGDRYQLTERIGEGSTGVVYRSFDSELEGWVAVKLFHPALTADAAACAELRRAVRLARRVTHRNVIRVFEFGRDGARQFVTMEHVAAESLLARRRRSGRLPPEQVPGLAIDLCKGLAVAHAASVIHGDIKPGNILLAPDRGVVLTNFGVALALGLASVDGPGALYRAPELLHGATATPGADLYALAVLLFEELTGLHPWPGDDDAARVASKRAGVAPDLRGLAPGLAGGWSELLGACLRFDPAARPRDAEAMLVELVALYRGTGHVAMALTRHGEESIVPLGSWPGVRWIGVVRLESEDEALHHDSAWISADLVHALRHVRSLRVVSAGSGPGGGPLTEIRGTLHPHGDGLRIVVRIVPGDGTPASCFVVQHPRALLPSLGIELAARILKALGVVGRPTDATRPDLLHPDAVGHYIQARLAMMGLRTAEALGHYEAALALVPRHRALRLGYAVARARHAMVFRSPTGEELAELRALIEASVAEYSDSGEGYLAMATLLFANDEPVESTRWACIAAARAPLLGVLGVAAHLTAIGRLEEAARRLDLAAALEHSGAQLWLLRADLVAAAGRWDEFYAIFNGPLTSLRVRGVYAVQWMLWHPDLTTLERLADDLATAPDPQRPESQRDLLGLVDFLLARRDRGEIVRELAAIHGAGARSYHSRRMTMALCEMACMLGDLPRARALLARADEHNLIEWHWLTVSPNLTPLHDDPGYVEVLAHVRERADAVAEAIWG